MSYIQPDNENKQAGTSYVANKEAMVAAAVVIGLLLFLLAAFTVFKKDGGDNGAKGSTSTTQISTTVPPAQQTTAVATTVAPISTTPATTLPQATTTEITTTTTIPVETTTTTSTIVLPIDVNGDGIKEPVSISDMKDSDGDGIPDQADFTPNGVTYVTSPPIAKSSESVVHPGTVAVRCPDGVIYAYLIKAPAACSQIEVNQDEMVAAGSAIPAPVDMFGELSALWNSSIGKTINPTPNQ